MTAGSIMDKMELKERYAYINGMVEGMAYARFRKDTLAAGQRTETGSQCIRSWFYAGDGSTYDRIETEFRKNAEHMPSTIIAVLMKKECGE